MSVVQALGLKYVEASADNECDPLYTNKSYLADWGQKVREASKKTGVTVSQFFSGHGTYATLGLCHNDPRIREHILQNWMLPMSQLAGSFNTNFGFFAHGFSLSTLESPLLYNNMLLSLYGSLSQIAVWANQYGCKTVGVEQMYSPHQPPWTLNGTQQLLQAVYAQHQKPMYLTMDVGHQVGQAKFIRPQMQEIDRCLGLPQEDALAQMPWLGSREAEEYYRQAAASPDKKEEMLQKIQKSVEEHSYCFSDKGDEDTYLWMEKFGAYSPIVHLQQTTGESSQHLPFTDETNASGKIKGDKILKALQKSYQSPQDSSMPQKAEDVYLTLEIFSKTNDKPGDIIDRLRKSVQYWRQFVPQDGMELSDLL